MNSTYFHIYFIYMLYIFINKTFYTCSHPPYKENVLPVYVYSLDKVHI